MFDLYSIFKIFLNIIFRINQISSVFLISLLLIGCTTHSSYQSPTTMIKSDHLLSSSTSELQLIDTNKLVSNLPKKNNMIDWQDILLPMVYKMQAIDNIKNGSVLLVTTMKNNTNGNLQTNIATSILTQLIQTASSKFQLFSSEKLNIANKILGLSDNDNLELLNNAVRLARYLNAQYVLYSIASGDVQHPNINLQLLLVRTGEIVWSVQSTNIS